MKVIGFASGQSAEDAFKNLINENKYLIETSFNEVICYKLDKEYEKTRQVFFTKRTILATAVSASLLPNTMFYSNIRINVYLHL